jgi:hypothetical protein
MRIPIGVLRQLDEHLPCVEAEQQLGLLSILKAATGRMKELDATEFLEELKQRANRGRRSKPVKATDEDLAAMGIKTVYQTKD